MSSILDIIKKNEKKKKREKRAPVQLSAFKTASCKNDHNTFFWLQIDTSQR